MSDSLTIYLRDHHAAGRAGLALARRAADEPGLASCRDQLATVASEIEEDLHSLESIMAALDVEPSAAKDTMAAVGERITWLKAGGSRLGDILELESLAVGIAGKEAMWWSLTLVGSNRLGGVDLDRLIGRAQQQRKTIEACRLEIARLAFERSFEVKGPVRRHSQQRSADW